MISKLDKRRKQILSLLAEVPISSTQQLAESTGVSTETMRKDLDALSEEGFITKMHGGVALSTPSQEIPFELRAVKNVAEKRRIAKKAVSLIQEKDTILLESCTTNLELIKELLLHPELLKSLIIITNSFSIASLLDAGKKCSKLFFLGGWANPKQFSTLGQQTTLLLKDFLVSKAFLSGAALSNQMLLTGYYDDDVSFQKAALSSAQEIILMIDSSKFQETAVLFVASLSQFNYLITDKELSREELSYIESEKVQYIKA